MDYEKKYKEMKARVLEMGRGYVKGLDYSKPRQIAEYIDPELKESGEHRVDYPICTEYTRTDTFIEEACVKLKKLMYDNLMFQGRLHREEVINNFVEDFKKYMEG